MTLALRLDKLEEVLTPPMPAAFPAGFDLEAEAGRWLDLLAPVEGRLGPADGDLVLAAAADEFDLVGAMADGSWPCGAGPTRQMVAQVRRWPGAVAAVMSKLPPDLAAALARALAPGQGVSADPAPRRLAAWLSAVVSLRGRVPPDASAEAVGGALRAFVTARTRDAFCRTCPGCGLHRLYTHLDPDRCPHCGAAGGGYTHHDDAPAAWRALAEQELDPDLSEKEVIP
jgi:hypothetical protein